MWLNDDIIKFDTAILAANLGFNLNVIGTHVYNYYNEDGSLGCISWGHLHTKSPCASPQSLLKKWIRKVHGIHVEIYSNASGWGWILTKINGTVIKEITDDHFYEEYEDALEAGLVIALQFINFNN